jgi:tetratricopeptide (TPR) repeat protein
LAKRDRRALHLAAAAYLQQNWAVDEGEVVQVIASHYVDAYEADPAAADGDDIRAEARRWFTRAAERAASLAASREAQRAFVQAADLAAEEIERGRSLARAGEYAVMGSRLDEAAPLLEDAIDILGRAGARTDAARAEASLGELLLVSNRIDEGVAVLQRALAAHESVGDEAAIASVSVELGRLLFFEERREEALLHVERALEIAERLQIADVVVQGLINKSLLYQRRPNESVGLMRQAVMLAEQSGDERGAMRAYMNLSFLLAIAARNREAEEILERGIGLARRRGDRSWELALTGNLVSVYFVSGRWDELAQVIDELPEDGWIGANPIQASMKLDLATVAMYRGEIERARELAAEYAAWEDSPHVQARGVRYWARVIIAQLEGRHEDAVAECFEGLRDPGQTRNAVAVEVLLVAGCDSARALGSADAIAELIALAEAAPLVHGPPLQAQLALQRARLALLRQEDEPPFEAAVDALGAIPDAYWHATALLEQAEWLAAQDRAAEAAPLAAEARATFERLRVPPMLERVARLEGRDASLEAALEG